MADVTCHVYIKIIEYTIYDFNTIYILIHVRNFKNIKNNNYFPDTSLERQQKETLRIMFIIINNLYKKALHTDIYLVTCLIVFLHNCVCM